MNLLLPIKAIAKENKKVMVFFSLGKDSIVTLDLISKYIENYEIVFFYYYKNLNIKEKVLKFYERKTGKKIIRLPHPERMWFFHRSGIKDTPLKVVINDSEEFLRKKYNCQYVAYGHRLSETLCRRAMLSKIKDGVDHKFKRVYPILFFKKAHIFEYIKQNKLLLPIEYKYKFRNIDMFKGDSLLWLYNNFRDDYNRIIQEFPFIEEDFKKAQWKHSIY